MEQENKNPSYNQAQYDRLNPKNCQACRPIERKENCQTCPESKKIVEEWNKWRKENPSDKIELSGASLQGFYLEGINFERANLKNTWLIDTHLGGANLRNAQFECASNDTNYYLDNTSFTGATLDHSSFNGAKLLNVHFEGAKLFGTEMKDAIFIECHFEGANLSLVNIEGTRFGDCHLQCANFNSAEININTIFHNHRYDQKQHTRIIDKLKIDEETDFIGVELSNIIPHVGSRLLLEYNIRHKNWEDWYKSHPRLKWVAKLFWLLSDYGRSTGRIIGWFFLLAVVFGLVYFLFGSIDFYNSDMDKYNLIGDLLTKDVDSYQHIFLRSMYFSIVTMTTLGFGDMHANPSSSLWWLGYLMLMIQVLLGYVMLGALVTRFAVLFTSGGPAGEFVEMDEETKKLLKELKEKENGK